MWTQLIFLAWQFTEWWNDSELLIMQERETKMEKNYFTDTKWKVNMTCLINSINVCNV